MPALFPAAVVSLASCALEPLAPRDAAALGARLAVIDPWRTLGLSAATLTRNLLCDDPSVARYVVLVDGEAAGAVALRHPWLRGPFLELLAVFEPRQRSGLGREIVEWIAGTTRAAAPNLWVTVSSFNARARAFYAALGFGEIAALPNLIAPGRDEILLRLDVRAPAR